MSFWPIGRAALLGGLRPEDEDWAVFRGDAERSRGWARWNQAVKVGCARAGAGTGRAATGVMDEATYRTLLSQFLNEYWGAFHEALEAQSVNPRMLATPLFQALVNAHGRFAAARDGVDPAVERLGRLWAHVADRRTVTFEAPLSAHEVEHARTQFEAIYDTLLAAGKAFPHAAKDVAPRAVHGTPRDPLRADAIR